MDGPLRAHSLEKTAALAVASAILGAVFGRIAGFAGGLGYVGDVCAFFGAMVGLCAAPVLVRGLRDGDVMTGLVVVFFPTALGAALGGAINPLVGLAVSMTCFVASSMWWGRHERRRLAVEADPNLCRGCGYSLMGLPSRICPECGLDHTDLSRNSSAAAARANLVSSNPSDDMPYLS